MADIRIRVGASLDASVDAVFPRVAKAAAKARVDVEREFATKMPAAMRSGAGKTTAEFDKLASSLKRGSANLLAPGTRSIVDFANQSTQCFRGVQASFTAMARVMEREMRRVEDMQARKQLGLDPGGKTGKTIWGSRMPLLASGIGFAGRLAGDLARGAGISTDAGAYVHSYIERQSLATDIANSGYQPGAKGAAGKLQDSAAIQAEAMKVASATATDPMKALEGLQKFVATTGDLETGRAILGDMAKLSNATGSNLEDVVTAAGDVSAKLGDVPNKAEAIGSIMRQIAGQGKLGAVEMRDFAKQLASVAAAAPQFSGSVEKNIGERAILLQEGRQLGGAKNAAQAATGVRAFVSTMTKGARVKEFSALGISLRNKDGGLRSAEEIILESLSKTKGNANQLYGKLFTSEQSKVAVRGFETIYNQTKGSDAEKLRAVAAEFDRLRKATMSQSDVEEANARKMQTSAAMVQELNNALQAVADEASAKLLPVMKDIGPTMVTAVGAAATALAALAPVAKLVAQSLGFLVGGGPEKITHDVSAVSNDIKELGLLTGFNPGGKEISKKDFARYQADRNNIAERVDQDRETLNEKLKVFNPDDRAKVLAGDTRELEQGAKAGGKKQQEALAAYDTYAKDKATSDAMEAAVQRVMQQVFAGTLKVEVVNQPAPGKAPVVADQTGRMPPKRS